MPAMNAILLVADTAAVQAIIQIVKVLLGLGNQAIEPLNRLALNLAVEQIAELHLLAVD
jgi:hypothetical protein